MEKQVDEVHENVDPQHNTRFEYKKIDLDIPEAEVTKSRAILLKMIPAKWRYSHQIAVYTRFPWQMVDIMWTRFRNTDDESVRKYGPAKKTDQPFDEAIQNYYDTWFRRMFVRFVRMDTEQMKDKPLSLRFAFDTGFIVDIWRMYGTESKYTHMIQACMIEDHPEVWDNLKKDYNLSKQTGVMVISIVTAREFASNLELFGVSKDRDYDEFQAERDVYERERADANANAATSTTTVTTANANPPADTPVDVDSRPNVNSYLGVYSDDVYVDIAEDGEFTNIIGFDTLDIDADSYTLTNYWRYFRVTDKIALERYGFPNNNKGEPIQEFDAIDDNYSKVAPVFEKFIQFEMGTPMSLKISTRSGGIYIRRVYRYKHKFVTADLSPDPSLAVANAVYEQ